jgi:TRAP-type C4-dicarboxylate transport system permease small subunit
VKWLDRLITFIGSMVPAAMLAVVLIVVTANVIARTILGIPFHAAHEIAILALAGMVWFGLVGAAVNGQLFGVTFFVERLPRRLANAVSIVARLVVVMISFSVMRAAWAQIETARFTRFLALGWPKWIVSAGLLLSMAVLILVQLRQIRHTVSKSPADEEKP